MRTAWIAAAVVAALIATGGICLAAQKVCEVEGISEYVLDNGLRVVLFKDTSKPTVTVNITYFVGSRHEGRGQYGMAHLFEHMLFKGTKNFEDPWKALEDHGAWFNGSTWLDRTNYFETLPSTEENLEFALRLEADRMVNSLLRKEDLDTEWSVVLNEFGMGENRPTHILAQRMTSTAFLWHNYGHSTIGSRSDIQRVKIEKLREFYREYYQPDNALLVIAGDFDPERALALVEKHFGPIPRPERVLDDTYTIEPTQDGPRHVELHRVGDVAVVGALYHICAAAHPDFAALDVLDNVLTSEPSGLLYKGLVEEGYAARVYSSLLGNREPNVVRFMAVVADGKEPQEVLDLLLELLESPDRSVITAEAVERAKTQLLKQNEQVLRNSTWFGIHLSEWAASGDWRLFFLHRDRIEDVTLEDVRRVAEYYFKASNRTSGTFVPTEDPQRVEIPATPDVAELLADYRGREALSEGETIEADPETLEARIERFTLDNGMKVAFLAKETRGDVVNAQLKLHTGSEERLRGRTVEISLLPRLLLRGTERRGYQELLDELDRRKSSLGGWPGELGDATFYVSSDRANIVEVLRLLAEVLQQPSFPAEEFALIKQEEASAVESRISDPRARAYVELARQLHPYPPDDPRHVPSLEERLAAIRGAELESLISYYRESYGGDHAELTLVGDFDPAELRPVISELFGNWRAPKPWERIPQSCQEVPGGRTTINTPDKEMALTLLGLCIPLRDDDPDYPALFLGNYLFGAGSDSRLRRRLREEEGFSYSTRSYLDPSHFDPLTEWAATAISSPENLPKVLAAIQEELQQILEEEVPPEELERAKEAYRMRLTSRLSSDNNLVSMINRGLYLDRTLLYYRDFLEKLQALEAEDVQQALRKYIVPEKLVVITAGDLEQPESDAP
jgi:zinc protease